MSSALRLALFALAVLPVTAQISPASSTPCPRAAFYQKRFEVEGLVVGVQGLGVPMFGATLAVENTTGGFVTVNLEDLLVVNTDGRQSVLAWAVTDKISSPYIVKLAPGAHLGINFVADKPYRFPVKVYFRERLLGVLE